MVEIPHGSSEIPSQKTRETVIEAAAVLCIMLNRQQAPDSAYEIDQSVVIANSMLEEAGFEPTAEPDTLARAFTDIGWPPVY